MTRNGQLYELPTWEPPTDASESSLLRTPAAAEAEGGPLSPLAGGTGEPDAATVGADHRPGPSWDTPGLTLLPTPTAQPEAIVDPEVRAARVERSRVKHGRPFGESLSSAVGQLLPTPRAADSTGVRGRTPNRNDAANAKAGLTLTDACQDTFGPYATAIQRWEQMLGRPAPDPTEPGKNRPRLASRFVEFLMGLDDGHVTGVGLTRPQELKALGNGVVPQQGAAALAHLHSIRSTNP